MDAALLKMLDVETVVLSAEEETAFEAALDIYRDDMEGEPEMVEQVAVWRDLAAKAFQGDVGKIPASFSHEKRAEAIGSLARFHVYASADTWQATLEAIEGDVGEMASEAA